MTTKTFLLACAASAACALLGAPAAAQSVSAQRSAAVDYEAYRAELNDPGAQFVVVSNHFRHDVGCTSRGCILMGPTEDRDACDDWASRYNRVDPYDHARCVESADYDQVRY